MSEAARTPKLVRRCLTVLAVVLLGATGCVAEAPSPPRALSAAEAAAILQQFDFPVVKELQRRGDAWQGLAYRDGVWVPVSVWDDGTIIARSGARSAAPMSE
jgi:hypothetical protein